MHNSTVFNLYSTFSDILKLEPFWSNTNANEISGFVRCALPACPTYTHTNPGPIGTRTKVTIFMKTNRWCSSQVENIPLYVLPPTKHKFHWISRKKKIPCIWLPHLMKKANKASYYYPQYTNKKSQYFHGMLKITGMQLSLGQCDWGQHITKFPVRVDNFLSQQHGNKVRVFLCQKNTILNSTDDKKNIDILTVRHISILQWVENAYCEKTVHGLPPCLQRHDNYLCTHWIK